MIAAVVATTAAACGTSTAEQAAPSADTTTAVETTTPAPATTAAVTTTTTPAPPTATTTAGPTTLATVEFVRNEAVYFSSADGRFQCGIVELASRVEAGCQGTTTPVPPRPDDCMIGWGNGIRITGDGRGAFMCAGGPIYLTATDAPGAPLAAGQKVSSFGYTCTSEAAGVTCRKDDTGHGFRIAAASNEVF
ncbi:hypothetical protein SAMN05444580_10550 [Rhodococcus tukisamuensis]|uniref:Uncharacterized protein n=1 Tax=Rhodococcus tukisamuensis TaxID=168276 RepID=A0A1G6VL81_9NOCA|nr:hypothetical protein SAMN05444580_10550 [Rhodococcus tukisamuensis]